jgi:hypothetical protein
MEKNSVLLLNNSLENKIFRCPKCFYVPLISLKYDKNNILIHTLCQNKHNLFTPLSNFLTKESQNHSIFFQSCNYCKLKENKNIFFCNECNFCFCEKCKSNHLIQHNVIEVEKFDNYCLKHKIPEIGYCLNCNKNFCLYCEEKHKNHINEKISNILLKESEIKEISSQIENKKKFLEKITYIKNKIVNNLNETINNINLAYKNFYDKNSSELLFINNLLETYLYKEKQSQLNYNFIKNLKISNQFTNISKPKIKTEKNLITKANILITYFNTNFLLKSTNFLHLNNTNTINKSKKILTNLINITTLSIKTKQINNLLLLKNGRFISCHYNPYIHVYNENTYEIEIKIKDNDKGKEVNYIYQLKDEDEKILSSSYDKTIKIIKIFNKNYEIEKILYGHNSTVLKAIQLLNGNICSCSWDGTIKIWSKFSNNNYDINYSLISQDSSIYSVLEMNENEIVSTHSMNYNYFLKFWLLDRKICIKEIEINCVYLSNNNLIKINDNIVSVGGVNKIYLIDIESFEILTIFNLNISVYSIFKLSDNSFLMADNKGVLNQYTFDEKKNEFNLIGQIVNKDKIFFTCFAQLLNGDIVIGDYKGLINIWK